MFGVPVVSTKVGDAEEMVGSFGVVVPDRSPVSMSRAVEATAEDLIKGNYSNEDMRKVIEAKYSTDSMTARYEGLFRVLLK
jgi:glycosyltransferase involved in cell wall biosynthesis